ncbi:MAG TPA: excinuclease ABC subunit UvrC, partial [Clostridia bacterium]|nr:excinuclease ABC subunit UvrC [Clostridia bacterium]
MDIEKVLSDIPDSPGIYKMLDVSGKVIYVGKAKSLKKRVRSYFTAPARLSEKTRALVDNIDAIEYVLVDNEQEALLLECNLIKQYKPKYNILLKDDKGFPYIRIDRSKEFPYLELARRYENDGAQYFGPYLGASVAREIAELVNDSFMLRTCSGDMSRKKKECLRYHLKKCLAPCRGVDKQEYNNAVKEAVKFLKGGHRQVVDILRTRMNEAASRFEYEQAAKLRDQIAQIEKVMSGQKIVLSRTANLDIAAAAVDNDSGYACVQLFFIRGGIMTGTRYYEIVATELDTPETVLSSFIISRYSDENIIPREIVTACPLENAEELMKIISTIAGKSIYIGPYKRGAKKGLAEMAARNAHDRMTKSVINKRLQSQKSAQALSALAQVLGLDAPPSRIEAYDISNIQGT